MLKRRLSFAILAFILCTPEYLRAQNEIPSVDGVSYPESPEYLSWDTFGDADDEFHARLPEAPSVFVTNRKVKDRSGREGARVYGAYKDGVVYVIVVYDKPHKGETLDYFVGEFKNHFLSTWDVAFKRLVTVNMDTGKEYSLKKGDVAGAVSFFMKPRHAYMAMAVGSDGDDADEVERFVTSFTMWDFTVDRMRSPHPSTGLGGSDATPAQASTDADSGRILPGSKEDVGQYVLPGIKAIAALKSDSGAKTVSNGTDAGSGSDVHKGAREGIESPDDGLIFGEEELSNRAFIVVRPEPDYTEEARLYRIEGTVRLRGVLRTSGKVEDISVVEGLPHGLTEKAVQAFRHLRFLPAQHNGHRVSQWVTTEYNFAIR